MMMVGGPGAEEIKDNDDDYDDGGDSNDETTNLNSCFRLQFYQSNGGVA